MTSADPDALTRHAQALHALDRLPEAEAALRRALALCPGEPARYGALAVVLQLQGRWHEALALLDVGASLAPHDPDIGLARAELLLRLGRLTEGWVVYENRFRTASNQRLATKGLAGRPAWRGEPLEGRRIFLIQEQGLGDTIQFARYASLVAGSGGAVVLGVEQGLRDLLRSVPGVSRVVCSGEPMPPFDVHCHLMSLPRLFGTTLETIPATIPYLAPDKAAAERWRAWFAARGPGLRVGIAWAGNPAHRADHDRSIPFPLLDGLWGVPGVTWYSLQVGPRAADVGGAAMAGSASGAPYELSPHLTDFAASAAVVAGLDLVISVDTSVAHLAGALGRPVWLLLPFPADWRWLRHGETTPWYATMRLFRQEVWRRWEPVLDAVADALLRLGP